MVQTAVREREVGRGRLPAARRDRRPALAALAVLLILLGALGSALIAFRSGDRVSVLVAARPIAVGEVVDASDFRTVKVAGDTGQMAAAAALDQFPGSRALVTVPVDTFINPTMFSKAPIIPSDAEEVGVVVNVDQRPGDVPSPNDVVRLYYVDSNSAQNGPKSYNPGDPVVNAARVVDVSSGGSGDVRNVTVVATRNDAGVLAALSATNNLAFTILPSDTKPPVDLVSPGQ